MKPRHSTPTVISLGSSVAEHWQRPVFPNLKTSILSGKLAFLGALKHQFFKVPKKANFPLKIDVLRYCVGGLEVAERDILLTAALPDVAVGQPVKKIPSECNNIYMESANRDNRKY